MEEGRRSTLDGEEGRRSTLGGEEGALYPMSRQRRQLAVDRPGKFNVFWEEQDRAQEAAASAVGTPMENGLESLTSRSPFGGGICTH